MLKVEPKMMVIALVNEGVKRKFNVGTLASLNGCLLFLLVM